MRTVQREARALTTFAGRVAIGAAASGSNNGVDWWGADVGQGLVTFRFDTRLIPISASGAGATNGFAVRADSFGPGTVRFVVTAVGTSSLVNDTISWTITCVDKRT